MYEVTRKVTCDRCGADVVHYNEWTLSILHWEKKEEMFTAWGVELCEECSDALLAIFEKFGLGAHSEE